MNTRKIDRLVCNHGEPTPFLFTIDGCVQDSWWLHIDYYWEKAAEDATWKSVINEDLAMKFLQRTDVGHPKRNVSQGCLQVQNNLNNHANLVRVDLS